MTGNQDDYNKALNITYGISLFDTCHIQEAIQIISTDLFVAKNILVNEISLPIEHWKNLVLSLGNKAWSLKKEECTHLYVIGIFNSSIKVSCKGNLKGNNFQFNYDYL